MNSSLTFSVFLIKSNEAYYSLADSYKCNMMGLPEGLPSKFMDQQNIIGHMEGVICLVAEDNFSLYSNDYKLCYPNIPSFFEGVVLVFSADMWPKYSGYKCCHLAARVHSRDWAVWEKCMWWVCSLTHVLPGNTEGWDSWPVAQQGVVMMFWLHWRGAIPLPVLNKGSNVSQNLQVQIVPLLQW